MLDINPNEIQDTQFGIAKAGTYVMSIDEIEAKLNSNGKPYLGVKHSFTEPVEATEPGAVVGSIYNNIYVNSTGAINGFFVPFLLAVGVDLAEVQSKINEAFTISGGDAQKFVDELGVYTQQFVGQQVSVNVKEEKEYKDKAGNVVVLDNPRNTVVKYNRQ